MSSDRPFPRRSTCWLMVSTLLVVAACAATRTSSAPDPAPATADATASAPSASASSTPSIDVVYWATPQRIVDKILELAATKSTDVVYDLGCGDARNLVTAAQRCGARGFGFDIDPRRVTEARENVRRNRVENLVQIEHADIFFVDLSRADVVLKPRRTTRHSPSR